MSSQPDRILGQLGRLETTDEVLAQVAAKCRAILMARLPEAKLPGLRIFVTDFAAARDSVLSSGYFTENCQAVLIGPPTVVVNAAFLLELESALRSFDLADPLLCSPFLRSDEDLFALVRRIGDEPAEYLRRLRRLTRTERPRDPAACIETLTLITLFFISHEIGHLLDNAGGRSYTSFVQADAPLENRVANAVVKLCRHADEFAKYGFRLPGADETVRQGSEIRQREEELAQQIGTLKQQHSKWFADESSADRHGEELLTKYLVDVCGQNAFLADQYRYLAVKGLFAASLYSWYKDLLTFGEKMGVHGLPSSRGLMLRMMQDRETYVHAASLFGAVHRFTLLRAVIAIEAIIRSGSDIFDRPEGIQTIWGPKAVPAPDAPPGARWAWQGDLVWQPQARDEDRDFLRQWWLAESLQRYCLLSIHMDTAIKIAVMGCSTGWMLEKDRERGTPQLFMMNFESIHDAVARLRRFR